MGSLLDFALPTLYPSPPWPVTCGLNIPEPSTTSLHGAMDVAAVLDLFDPDHARARQAYPQFVAQGMGNLSPWTHITGQIYLGSPAFRERMATQVPQAQLTASDI